ncbi:MAG: hypothetical protein WBP81_14285 [Solirubrobacteraceae bacterium]
MPGTYGDLTSYPLSQFCQPKQPQPSPGQGGTGVSNGDPYITTFDGGGYGFQTAGELLALTGYRRERGGSCVSYVGTSEGAGSRRWAAVAASVR